VSLGNSFSPGIYYLKLLYEFISEEAPLTSSKVLAGFGEVLLNI